MSHLIIYGEKYYDDTKEYRWVTIPHSLAYKIKKSLMTEFEWRSIGIQMSQGWQHSATLDEDNLGKSLLFGRLKI